MVELDSEINTDKATMVVLSAYNVGTNIYQIEIALTLAGGQRRDIGRFPPNISASRQCPPYGMSCI
jgi:hypothetical protein